MISDKLLEQIDKRKNPCSVGLDPDVEKMPEFLFKGNSSRHVADAFIEFNHAIIDAVADLVPVVKPQIAFYEAYGEEGVWAFKNTVDYAREQELCVIEDGKRNDIGNTARKYAQGHLGCVNLSGEWQPSLDLDLLTVNPFLGSDCLKPFVEECEKYSKGIFVLVKTSNPSSGEYQDRLVKLNENESRALEKLGIECSDCMELYHLAALQVNEYAQKLKGERGYSPIGAVVGATYPQQAEVLRKIMPDSFFLVPGYGAQGGSADDIVACFNDDGCGAVINSSRNINYAFSMLKDDAGELLYKPSQFAEASRHAAKIMIDDVCSALEKAGKVPQTML